jgi:endonuclease YncB( thermonuclease family)
MRGILAGFAVLAVLAGSEAMAQTVTYGAGPNRGSISNRNDVSYSRGTGQRRPRNYDYYYYGGAQTMAPITPVTPVTPAPVVLGPVRPYTDDEYARLVLSTLSVPQVQPATQRDSRSIVVAEETDSTFMRRYRRAETKVMDVLDRGLMLTETREELRLRGVRMLSERDTDEVYRYYAREGIRTLREMTAVGNVFVHFEDPVRDQDGTLLGIIYLPDGTELNRLVLSAGLGRLEPRDFADDRNIADLVEAELQARDAKIGLWSHERQ